MASPDTVRAAAIQMSSGADVKANLRTVERMLVAAAGQGVAIAFLPENFAIMGARDGDKLVHAEAAGSGPIQEYLAGAAQRHSLWIVAGSLPLESPRQGKCYGASIVFDNEGNASPIYRKIHLFDVDLPGGDERYRESATMEYGSDPVIVATPLGQLGLSICYDLRFPEYFRRLVDGGATVFSVPAAFTATTGKAHWHTLLRARAIENLAYVIAAAQHGTHPNGRETYGHSAVIDPWGRVVAERDSGDALLVADIDTALPGQLRERFPVLEHRRLG